MNKKTMTFFILSLIMLAQFGIDIYLPSLPGIAKDLVVSHSRVQFSLTIYFIGFACFQLVYGIFSDRYGRRPLIFIGLLLFIFGSIAASVASSISLFYLARLIQGIGAAGGSSQARAMIRDTFKTPAELSRMAALVSMMWSLMPMLAPLVGGFLEDAFHWRMNFLVLTLTGFAMLLLVYFFLKETLEITPPKQSYFQNLKEIITKREFQVNTAASMGVSFLIFLFISLAPFYIQKTLHCTPGQCGMMLFVIGMGYFLGAITISFLVKRFNAYRLVFGWSVAVLSVSAGFTVLQSLSIYEIMLPMFLIYLCMGALYPLFFLRALMPFPHLAGTSSSIYGTSIFIAEGIGTLVACLLPFSTLLPFAIIATTISIIIFTLTFFK